MTQSQTAILDNNAENLEKRNLNTPSLLQAHSTGGGCGHDQLMKIICGKRGEKNQLACGMPD